MSEDEWITEETYVLRYTDSVPNSLGEIESALRGTVIASYGGNHTAKLTGDIAELENQLAERLGYHPDYGTQAQLDTIKDLMAQLADREWMPIESAPKDGTIIDLYENGRIADCTVCASTGKWLATDVYDKFGRELHIKNPTHWQPLCACPSTKS